MAGTALLGGFRDSNHDTSWENMGSRRETPRTRWRYLLKQWRDGDGDPRDLAGNVGLATAQSLLEARRLGEGGCGRLREE